MWEMIVKELTQVVHEFSGAFARFLPRLIVLVVIACVGWLFAYLLRVLTRNILRLIKFDRLSENAGASQLLAKAALPSSSELASRFIFWIAWLGFILLGVSVLGIFGLEEQIARFFLFLPRLFVSLFIMFFGLLTATFFSRAVLLAAVNADLPSPRLLSIAVRCIIVALVLSMVFEELGIASETILVAFGIVLGAIMLGLAIAFGIGGQALAQQFLERRLARGNKPAESDDELSPL